MTKSFIETQFPVSKVSKESHKERKAVQSQTLTGLGKWWGRKPLVLVRAALLGLLMPASDNPVKDREVFLKILTMDDEGLYNRKNINIPLKEIHERLTNNERILWMDPKSTKEKPKWKQGSTVEEKKMVQCQVFNRLTYDNKLKYCCRPEQICGPSIESWTDINAHLGTKASNITELVQQLGENKFGRAPRVGDAFCGGGSVPFEAARIGCESYGSDLNPLAVLLTWATLNIVGGGPKVVQQIHQAKHEIYEAVDRQIEKWSIESNEHGWRADAFLYCNEVICPECGWKVPLASSWLIGPTSRCVAKIVPNQENKSFDIIIESNVTDLEIQEARNTGTIKNSKLVCPNPNCKQETPITMLRGDRRDEDRSFNGLRMWKREDFVPHPNDVFQERLYCIRWVESYLDKEGREKTRRHFLAPDKNDICREEKVQILLKERFSEWQAKGYIPSRRIEPGYNTNQPIRERGWLYWHQLFTPRQLLVHGLLLKMIDEKISSINQQVAALLGIGRCCNWNSKLCSWGVGAARESIAQTFYNQALNPFYNFAGKGFHLLNGSWFFNITESTTSGKAQVMPSDARSVDYYADFWITDPPYADAINYHELSEFFLAWYEKKISKLFPEWYIDSKRALAITGSDENFRKSMVDCYKNLAAHMSENGAQIVMFTHQNAGVWADLALILWSAGLQVTTAWCITTETESVIRDGNYVQGTVLLVLRKQVSDETAFLDELYPEVEEEVKNQLNEMLALDDKEDPNFGDTDYQLAAYAAALRVLTRYSKIEDMDIARELSRARQQGEQSPVVDIIKEAVKIACDHLVPQGIESFTWKSFTPEERFYLKGLEIESHGEYRSGAYQELARGFGLREYRSMLAGNKANQTRLKTASQFGARQLGDSGFGATLVRHVFFAIRESVRTGEIVNGRNWFHNELKQEYWNQRQTVVKLLYYLASLGQNKNMPHWKDDADAARLLAGAVENDHV